MFRRSSSGSDGSGSSRTFRRSSSGSDGVVVGVAVNVWVKVAIEV